LQVKDHRHENLISVFAGFFYVALLQS